MMAHQRSQPPPPTPTFSPHFAQTPTAQPPAQIPFSDPFQTSRDPFRPQAGQAHGHDRRGSVGPTQSRGWGTPQPQPGQPFPNHHHPHHQHIPSNPPTPVLQHTTGHMQNGVGHTIPLGYEMARRGSPPASFLTRNMPPPSPPQMPPPSSSSSTHFPSAAPRGPPTNSPFAGIRDIANFSTAANTHRPNTGMSISSILGGSDEHAATNNNHNKPPSSSPHPSLAHPTATPTVSAAMMMRPPSPGRARASSMRESLGRPRDVSPGRNILIGEQRAHSALHERALSEQRRDINNVFGSPQFQRESPHSFRAFRPEAHEYGRPQPQHQQPGEPSYGSLLQTRPSSQPIEVAGPRSFEEVMRGEAAGQAGEGRFGSFRSFGEPLPAVPQPVGAAPPPLEAPHHRPDTQQPSLYVTNNNGIGNVTSQPRERQPQSFASPPQLEQRNLQSGQHRFQAHGYSTTTATPMREDQAGLFRPAFSHMADAARESIESVRPNVYEIRREAPRSSPPVADLVPYVRTARERPMTFEEHHRLEREQQQHEQQRTASDGSVHRSVLNLSPELARNGGKGRNSPLPQAVQGAQPRLSGPGGNPGIKMEFGRMFSGLGSGAVSGGGNGRTTPTPGITPTERRSPEPYDPLDGEDGRGVVAKAAARGGHARAPRRSHDKADTPDYPRSGGSGSNKRVRMSVQPSSRHHHHAHPHHHHHHPPSATGPPLPQQQQQQQHPSPPSAVPANPFSTMRFPPPSATTTATLSAGGPQHHHHYAHHHHHVAAAASVPPSTVGGRAAVPPAVKKPETIIHSQAVLDTVASLPRKHLGSQLYSPPDNAGIPLFKQGGNCTFMVRIPNFYLREIAQESERVGKKDAGGIWGTGVYTDDSDILTMLIHDGWILGPNDIDPSDHDATSPPPKHLTTRPLHPIKLPENIDAHVTILILPPLERYASTHAHGVHSRFWGEGHDGMSVMVFGLELVEARGKGYVERGPRGRKKRMEREMIAARGLLGLGMVGAKGKGVVV